MGETFTLKNWPTSSPLAEDELEILKERKTHHIIPLPAYDINGSLIEPLLYELTLKGALARINFKLTHWAIAKRDDAEGSNTYVADIETIQILAEPTFSTGTKRKISAKIPTEIAYPSSSVPMSVVEGKKKARFT